jgi:hypothetical protein
VRSSYHTCQGSRSRLPEVSVGVMTPLRLSMACLAMALLPACGAPATPPPPEPKPPPPDVVESEEQRARRDADRRGPLGIPEGHLPPTGECRVWFPGEPAGQQPPPGSCTEAEREAPPGSWIIYRPPEDKRVVHARVVDPARRGVIIRTDLYDAERGTYLGTQEADQTADQAADPPAGPPVP